MRAINGKIHTMAGQILDGNHPGRSRQNQSRRRRSRRARREVIDAQGKYVLRESSMPTPI